MVLKEAGPRIALRFWAQNIVPLTLFVYRAQRSLGFRVAQHPTP